MPMLPNFEEKSHAKKRIFKYEFFQKVLKKLFGCFFKTFLAVQVIRPKHVFFSDLRKLVKTTKGPAKTGGTCLIVFDFFGMK